MVCSGLLAAERSNAEVALALEEAATLLESQAQSRFRVAAYRLAARRIERLKRPAQEIFAEHGLEGLKSLPGIGNSLARSIAELLTKGRWRRLERWRRERQRSDALTSLPGIGAKLAERIRAALGAATLEDLEQAAFNGRLRQIPGIGRKRIRSIQEALAVRLHASDKSRGMTQASADEAPSVAELLELDRQYRHLAARDRLPRVAPKHFNPTHVAWLPIMQSDRGEKRYRVLYSNTSRAHRATAAPDWVVIYRDDGSPGQWTVITARYGPLRGRRVVRGRERECGAFYQGRLQQRELEL
ncbi:MAG TPA: helix-hairpin-helix domain-containing protein [Pirellulales bacterium]|nr:helix-hairpin-helix domain-containing protein [Pirellulales bacterium]